MADVDLDVHGVRYAQIHLDLKRDMKLQGLGFVALLDFTTVDTLKASLERVITDKTGRDGKVEAMCYYKKRRRGAVTITTQRDVMLACCEYPLVTRTGKPAPDTYIRVGVALVGFEKLEYRNFLRKALGMLPMTTTDSSVPRPACQKAAVGSLRRGGGAAARLVYGQVKAAQDDTYIIHQEPAPKRIRLAESMGWRLVGPSSPHAMEIKPVEMGVACEMPEICAPSPPPMCREIKDEPLDPDEGLPQTPHGTPDETSDDADDADAVDEQKPLTHGAHGLRLMWDQLRKMETRLNDMEGSQRGSSPPLELSSDEGPQPADLRNKLAALERRLLLLEYDQPQKDDPLMALEKRLAVMEKNISRTLSSVDKLSKALTNINRKHLKTNGAVDMLCQSVKKIRDSQSLGQSTLDQIQDLLLKPAPHTSSS